MSFSSNGVKFKYSHSRRNFLLRWVVKGGEAILSVLFAISLAGPMLFPQNVNAVQGVSKYLSYQGRLTDTSGNPFGGTPTNYCFSFSVFDSPAAGSGNKLWPTTATTTTILQVSNGIFNTSIGDVSTFDFSSNDTTYLNVDIATQIGGTCTGVSWETLNPRQILASVAYARVAADVWGTALRTNATSTSIGAGGGAGTPIWLNLDNKNTATTLGGACPSGSVNGSIWYNSSGTRALACLNNVVVALDNTTEITNLNVIGNTVGTITPISTGAVSFSGGPNITLSQVGNVIGISAGAGGGGASPAIRFVEGNIRQSISNITNISALTGRPIFIPFYVGGNLTASRIMIEMSRSTIGSNLFSIHAGFYSFANATQLSLIGSWSNSFSNTATASISGIRQFHITGVPTGASTLSAGNYILGLEFTCGNTSSMNYSIRGGITAGPPLGQIAPGANSYSTATSHGMFPFFGRYSTTVAALPNSIGASQVIAGFSGASTPVGAWFGIRAD